MATKRVITGITVTSVLIIVLLILVIPRLAKNTNTNVKKPPMRNMGPVTVNAMIIEPRSLENQITANGTLISNEEAELKSEISGRVTSINFKEGSRVSKGQLLIKIYDADLQAQLSKVNYNLQLASQKEQRQKQILSVNGISQEEYDNSLNQVNTLKADQSLLISQIEKTEIRAPFDGLIGLRYISPGAYITPATKIASIQNVNPLKVDFSLPQQYLNRVKPGQKITMTMPGNPEIFPGSVMALEPKIDLSSRSLLVRATCPNPGYKLSPGAFVKIELTLEKTSDAVMIPTEALVPDIRGEYVFVYSEGKAARQPVETGIRTPTELEITQGLTKGDTLIVSGIIQLKPKSPVKLGQFIPNNQTNGNGN